MTELSLDGGPWQTIEPVGKLFDARHLVFNLTLPADGAKNAERLITVRVFDRYDNVGLAKTVLPAEGK